MLTTVVSLLLLPIQQPPPSPPLPQRAYQPHLIDPGLDGGSSKDFNTSRGDFTPDGKLFIGYRRVNHPLATGELAHALTATIVDPERMNKDAHGHLDGFYDTSPLGNFAFGGEDEWPSGIIQWGHEVLPLPHDSTDPDRFEAVEDDYLEPGLYKMDPNVPLPMSSGSTQFTLALRPSPYGIPYPSDPEGALSLDVPVTHYTYKLWIVRLHSLGWVHQMMPNYVGSNVGKELVIPPMVNGQFIDDDSIFVAQTITVVVDAQFEHVVHTAISNFSPLHPQGDPDGYVRGIEPTITADGKLILFHGNGSDGGFIDGHARVTYIYNSTPCSASGWTSPRPITRLPDTSELTAEFGLVDPQARFRERYKLFAQPIKIPATADTPEYVYTANDNVRGAYPWVSRDGSFYMASCAGAEDTPQVPGAGFRTRVGNYVCGEITGGYLKHIDDIGVSPTRYGGKMHWPPTIPSDEDDYSWRTLMFSTDLRPGPWEALIGTGAPMPTQVSSTRIPILPVINFEADTYGEVRFEEADGNYLLYLACNESLELPVDGEDGYANLRIEADSTPDTSGQPTRASCSLNAGARFPQEVMSGATPALAREALRYAVGSTLGVAGPLHENIGFKGQGIVLGLDGSVDARGAPGLANRDEFTVQAFVKVVASSLASDQVLFEYGGVTSGGAQDPVFTVKVTTTGKIVASVAVQQGGRVTKQVHSPYGYNLTFGNNWVNPGQGWMHVAVTFEGTQSNATGPLSRLRMMLDGKQVNTTSWAGHSVVDSPVGTERYLAGPGRGTGTAVDTSNMAFVVDEIAVSGIYRTSEELYRDAYSVPVASELGPWPPEEAVPVPSHFERFGMSWPSDLDYDSAVVDLGRRLFADPLLSPPGVGRACSTCHDPAASFVTPGETLAVKVGGGSLPFNTPTLLNAAFGARKTFSGSADSLESQLVLPLTSGLEMGTQTMSDVVNRLAGPYGDEFQALFGQPVKQANLARAMAMYMRLLHTGQSAYDGQLLYERGEFAGGPYLSLTQQRGRVLFFGKARCSTCHRGSAFTDGDFHNIRSVKTTEQLFESGHDRGGFSGRESERGQLKTPSLRNVAVTGPWFHDGSMTELNGVSGLRRIVEHYNDPFAATGVSGTADRHLLRLGLTSDEMDDLVAFLESLTDGLTQF